MMIATHPPSPQSRDTDGFPNLEPSRQRQCLLHQGLTKLYDEDRRDSILVTAEQDSSTLFNADNESNQRSQYSPSLSQDPIQDNEVSNPGSYEPGDIQNDDCPKNSAILRLPFLGIVTEIPTGSFDDLTLPGQVEFSSRGSMFIGGKRAKIPNGLPHAKLVKSRKQSIHLPSPQANTPKRIMSADEEMSSNKIRSLYEDGTDQRSGSSRKLLGEQSEKARATMSQTSLPRPPESAENNSHPTSLAASSIEGSQVSSDTGKDLQSLIREEQEMAGGIEDWENVTSGEVDRYGFIVPSQASQGSSLDSRQSKSQRIQRVSTVLQIASEAPRRRRSRLGRSPSSAKSPACSNTVKDTKRSASRNNRPMSSQSSYRENLNSTQMRLRHAAIRLPHNRNHRILDEAGDMLTLPPGLEDLNEDYEASRAAEESRQRERRREEKWQKMAKIVNHDDRMGGGMIFDFDTKSHKVIDRTWKGIPDRWRATAWHAFLSASARRRKAPASDDELKAEFQELLIQGSPDDMQIDLDVPRTINSHIMFRKRYRGGQRLLFRVLHCLSIYFPNTGYVQGMAALAATLLCYFDEEMAFVMMVRLWQLRGLERLYQSGFEGLMQALGELEKGWLANGEVSAKLDELNITPTAYGTRWYLTLFNYSIPFPAQLRVWDVFMLLGDPDDGQLPFLSRSAALDNDQDEDVYHGSLDVLHAVSAALIDGTREILLDSDFENAMKVLTSWIPVRDEELLMRVAKAEWKMHRRKK
ncbi:MAG: hypothetical protein Q9219_001683 [cf. Caloplaca sp. 3 TL-2023]